MSRTSKMFSDVVMKLKTSGDIAEVGVLTGTTFKVLCGLAKSKRVMAHAFDSFHGMAEPTAKDLDANGKTIYPKGRFDIGGVAKFHQCMKIYHIPQTDYRAYQGFVPDCLNLLHPAIKLSYARLDLDQYQPTLLAARWALGRLNVGGILSSHDYFPNARVLASMAMDDFIVESFGKIEVIGHDEDEVFIRKIA
jgi:hypothetical protein